MTNDLLRYLASRLKRCVACALEEYENNPETFAADLTRQDAAILNIQRACETALDMGQYIIRREGLGNPQSRMDVFDLLHKAGWIDVSLLPSLKCMIDYIHTAVHDPLTLQVPITISIITRHLSDLVSYCIAILLRDATS